MCVCECKEDAQIFETNQYTLCFQWAHHAAPCSMTSIPIDITNQRLLSQMHPEVVGGGIWLRRQSGLDGNRKVAGSIPGFSSRVEVSLSKAPPL